MDIELARTFLAIANTGSFINAASRLHVTQTAVTARVQNLESQLGCALFIRNRSGARLTPEGERFVGFATQLVQMWDAARRDVPLPDGIKDSIALGAEPSLANPLMLHWVTRLRKALPANAIRVEIASGAMLQSRLESGLLDLALVYQPEYAASMQIEQVLEEKLIQIASSKDAAPYVYVDWGPDFKKAHDAALPDKARPAMSFDFGPLAFQYIIRNGGTGYFRTRVARRALEEGSIVRVENAPEFSYPMYMVHSRDNKSELLRDSIGVLREVMQDEAAWAEPWDFLR